MQMRANPSTCLIATARRPPRLRLQQQGGWGVGGGGGRDARGGKVERGGRGDCTCFGVRRDDLPRAIADAVEFQGLVRASHGTA